MEGDAFRLIPSRFPPVNIYEEVIANDRIEALVEIENLTNPRLRSAQRLMSASLESIQSQPASKTGTMRPSPIPTRRARGFPPERPSLDLADSRQTALAVSVARRELFLRRTSEPAVGLDMRMLKTPIDGRFLDLRSIDPDLDKDARWALGAEVPQDVDGILYRPPERPSATCVAVASASALQRSIQTVHYRYLWNGSKVIKLYAFDDVGTELSPLALGGVEDIVAA